MANTSKKEELKLYTIYSPAHHQDGIIMETKEQLIITIRNWVKIDNEIRKLRSEITSRKNEQKNISTSLINVKAEKYWICSPIFHFNVCFKIVKSSLFVAKTILSAEFGL